LASQKQELEAWSMLPAAGYLLLPYTLFSLYIIYWILDIRFGFSFIIQYSSFII